MQFSSLYTSTKLSGSLLTWKDDGPDILEKIVTHTAVTISIYLEGQLFTFRITVEVRNGKKKFLYHFDIHYLMIIFSNNQSLKLFPAFAIVFFPLIHIFILNFWCKHSFNALDKIFVRVIPWLDHKSGNLSYSRTLSYMPTKRSTCHAGSLIVSLIPEMHPDQY